MGIKFDENCSNQNEGMVNPGESDKTSNPPEEDEIILKSGGDGFKISAPGQTGKIVKFTERALGKYQLEKFYKGLEQLGITCSETQMGQFLTFYEMLIEKNIFARKYFYPLTSQQACFKNKYRHIELDNAKRLADNVLVLPFHADLEKSTVERIVEIIKG